MRFILLFSLLFACYSCSTTKDTTPVGITILPGNIIQYKPYEAGKVVHVKYTKSWHPAGQTYTLYGYKQIVVLKQHDDGSFEFNKYKEAFMAAAEDCRSLTQRN